MPDFNPQPNEVITIGGVDHKVAPHPAVPVFAFGQEGRKAHVFQLIEEGTGKKYALKRFKLAYRVPELIKVNDALAQFARWQGLEAAKRACLTTDKHPDVLAQYPDLEYAVLMPWISGSTWYDLLIGMTPLTEAEAVTFGKGMADVLAGLEEAGLAHCDIAAANVILNPSTGQAHLIDIEDMYAPGFQPPAALPAGTDGYAHQTSSSGLWHPEADRFAGAVIIAEMLAWHDSRIRKASEEEHYFNASEMQANSDDFRLMQEVLGSLDERLAELFEQVWFSDTLGDCPPMRAWQEVIQDVEHRTRVAKVASGWRPLTLPGAASATQDDEDDTPATQPAQTMYPHPTDVDEDDEVAAPVVASPQPQPSVNQPKPPAVQTQMPPPAAPAPVPVNTKGANTPIVEWRPLTAATVPASGGEDDDAYDHAPAVVQSPAVEFEPLDLSMNSGPSVAFDSLGRHPLGNDTLEEEPDMDDTQENLVSITDDPVEENDELLYDAELDETDNEEHTYEEALELMEDEGVYDDEPLEQGIEVDPVTVVEDVEVADAPIELDDAYIDEVYEEDYDDMMPLTVPQLDYNNIDKLGRPHLVWTESYGATGYILQESKDPQFSNPREFDIREETVWNPTMPRTGRLFYRIKAVSDDGNDSAWSEIVGVRIGER